MTETPYLDSPYERVFEATVERVASGDRAGNPRVVLDRTLFYPEGGGQPNDTGTLELAGDDEGDGNEWRVTDVQKKDTIYHAFVQRVQQSPLIAWTVIATTLFVLSTRDLHRSREQ